ncbi:hypothetical protein NHQ30_011455 [Ciborinia camelliae]|nr:hypothetical protein NHQ30_011455 [Ciborinia camelliae]
MATITLPYFVPSHELPQPLPSTQEIHDATDRYNENGVHTLVRIGPYMIKYGPEVNVIEGENMLFVSRETTVPVPRVYALYTVPEISPLTGRQEDSNYIIMEYIESKTLHDEWSLLSVQQRNRISAQLRKYMDELRALPSPGYYGSIGKRGLLDCIFWSGTSSCEPLDGPFDTEHELNEAMRSKVIFNGLPAEFSEFYRHAFPVVFQGHRPVFTHGDFQRKNIMIKRVPSQASLQVQDLKPDDDDAFEVVIIDWENSGWYPDYWESCLALSACGNWKDDWHLWIGKSLTIFYHEFGWMRTLRTELWS